MRGRRSVPGVLFIFIVVHYMICSQFETIKVLLCANCTNAFPKLHKSHAFGTLWKRIYSIYDIVQYVYVRAKLC